MKVKKNLRPSRKGFTRLFFNKKKHEIYKIEKYLFTFQHHNCNFGQNLKLDFFL